MCPFRFDAFAESGSRALTATTVAHPVDRSFACALVWSHRRNLRSTVQTLFQFPVKLLRLFPMSESLFAQFTCVRVDKRDLLHARMIVTNYNQHVRLLFSEPFGC